jgi:predicted GH43/DUF377 family glycosyl hydrolase
MKYALAIILFVINILLNFNILSAQIKWSKYHDNPILDVGPPGSWDSNSIYNPYIIFDGYKYHMWYTGNDSLDNLGVRRNVCIGYATSDDGIEWVKYPGNPVIKFGPAETWNSTQIISGPVLVEGDTLKMWYLGMYAQWWHTGFATSVDGINWSLYNDTTTTSSRFLYSDPVLELGPGGSWDFHGATATTVLFEDDVYKMWYTGHLSLTTKIGYATSKDGVHWIKYDDTTTTDSPYSKSDPVMAMGPEGSWEDNSISSPKVIKNRDIYEMWYIGRDNNYARTGYATSEDGIHWTKYNDPNTNHPLYAASDPVLDLGHIGAWDDLRALVDYVILQDSVYKMWYAGCSSSEKWVYRIGYATSPVSPSPIIENQKSSIPQNYTLSQNHPNPFNPSTKIKFDLPKPETVTIEIYSIIGQKIETLLNKPMPAGYHEVTFDGQNLSSGIYLYRIEAGAWYDVKKMVLIK